MKVKVLMFWLYATLINATKFVEAASLQEWEDFKVQFAKHYTTPEEEKRRLKIFEKNLLKIAKHNKNFEKGKVSFKIGVNKFADMTTDEFTTTYLPKMTFSNYLNTISRSLHNRSVARSFSGDAPEYKNWVTEGAVTRVKHQGYSCGSCWAFTAVGLIEAHNYIRTGKLVELSEQNLLDCVGDVYIGGDKNANTSWLNNGCDGGSVYHALNYIMNNHGIDTEKSYPYTATQNQCHYKTEYRGAIIRDILTVPSKDEEQLKNIVGLKGPVTAIISTEDDLHLYRYDSGIYQNPVCGKNLNKNYINHAVLVVGYGVERNTPYWLVKNSWGREWGLGGYLKIRRGSNECDIALFNLYPII